MSSYINVYSHPNKLLTTHLSNVGKSSQEIFENMHMENNIFHSNISYIIGICHDFAKCTTFFQEHLNNGKNSEKAYHSFLSAIFGYYCIKSYVSKNNMPDEINYPILGYLVINRHHGDFINIKDDSGEYQSFKEKMNRDALKEQVKDIENQELEELKDFYNNNDIDVDDFLKNFNEIKKEIKKDLKKLPKKSDIETYILMILYFSVLIDSDKLDASYTDKYKRIPIRQDIVDIYKKDKFNVSDNINDIREEAYVEVIEQVNKINLDNKIYSIILPTGAGKTLAALSFSFKLRKRLNKEYDIKPRIIYCLPFLSIIDQTEEILKEILAKENQNTSDILIKHNSMSEIYYKTENEEALDLNKAELLIESWYSEIILTTFYQFFYTIITNKNKTLKKLHNIVNSIIILDEVQTVPPKYWNLVNELLLKFCEKFNIWIIFMTATQPAIFNENEITQLIADENKYFDKFNRVNYHYHKNLMQLDKFNLNIISKIEETADSIMIILNTLKSSIEVYEHIAETLSDYIYENGIELYYLSTNIIPRDRQTRIENIKKSTKQKIIVTTQLIEAGVDISVDIIYRDFAPVDNIIQSAGRCNRNNNKDKGEFHIMRLVNDQGKKYSNMIYDSIFLRCTEELLEKNQESTENEFNRITLTKYFKELPARISDEKSDELIKRMNSLSLKNITSDFKLIDKTFEKMDIFIDCDDESHRIWERYCKLYDDNTIPLFKRKQQFKKFKANFYLYVISVDVKKAGTTPYEKKYQIGYLDNNEIGHKYDLDTGFISEEDEGVFLI